MDVETRTYVTGPIETNTFLVWCGSECWIVDPGTGLKRLKDLIRGEGLTPTAIVLTHGHGDHLAGAGELKADFSEAQVICPAEDEFMLGDANANLSAPFGFPVTAPPADRLISPGETLELGDSTWSVLDTSGHTPGGVSLYCEAADLVIVGDALFSGSIGRTDFPGASTNQLVGNIKANLLTLPDQTRVLAGHGPDTTIGVEAKTNMFLTPSMPSGR